MGTGPADAGQVVGDADPARRVESRSRGSLATAACAGRVQGGTCAVCGVCAVCVRCVCSVCAVCVRCVCGMCTVCVRCVCASGEGCAWVCTRVRAGWKLPFYL